MQLVSLDRPEISYAAAASERLGTAHHTHHRDVLISAGFEHNLCAVRELTSKLVALAGASKGCADRPAQQDNRRRMQLNVEGPSVRKS